MTLVSLTDCCRLLAIDPKTLRRWLSLSHLSAEPSPHDARLKCITGKQVQLLATVHRRTLPDQEGLRSQSEIFASAAPTNVVSAPILSDVLPDSLAPTTALIKQLSSLQAHVASLEHQLTLLVEQLQKEQQCRISQTSPLEKSQESSLEKSQEASLGKSQESSLEKSQESSQKKESANVLSIDRRKHPRVLPLVEYGAGGTYVVVSPEHGMLEFSPDSPEWFAWLSTLPSFRFMGKLGRFTAHRGSTSPERSWRASRHIRNRSYNHSLGKTASLTIAELEQVAAALQSHLN